jgi:hypothetical protein
LNLFSFFRRRPAIGDLPALSEFIDRNAAFVTQKGLYEYSRARAGHYAKVLFGESDFRSAIEVARWRAYPLGLAMVAEVVEGILRPHSKEALDTLAGLKDLVMKVFDHYPVPQALSAVEWQEMRTSLSQKLDRIGLHAPKAAKDIPEPFVDDYFNLMPIHEKLRASDYPTTRNYLRVTLCNIHEEFSDRADVPALASALSASA